jgi:hypothetical protein
MNQLRVTICSACLILVLSVISYAQDDRNRPLVPEKDFILEPFDRYGDVSWENQKARLDNFAIALLNDSNLIGYIIVYAGKQSCAGDAQRRGLRAKKYLVEHRDVDWNRVIWKDAGYLEQPYIMLWGQVRGAQPYPFYQPQPLTNVKVKDCRAKLNRRKKRSKL